MEIHGMAGHLIRRLHQRSTHLFQNCAKRTGHDLTQVQFAAMEALKAYPGIDQARISALIAYDRATIGGVIERLEKKGLVQRVVNCRDRRAREVTLTEEGLRVVNGLMPTVTAMQDDILSNLDEDERRQFVALMGKALGLEP